MFRALERQEKLLDFLEPGRGILLRQPREFAANHDIILVTREHEFVLLDFDDAYGVVRSQNFQFGYLKQQRQRRRQTAEAISQFSLEFL